MWPADGLAQTLAADLGRGALLLGPLPRGGEDSIGFPENHRRMSYPATPDGRYFVVRGRLWRLANPALDAETRDALVHALMDARRAVGQAKRSGDGEGLREARARVDAAKTALGERGAVWWGDGAPDLNRRMAKNTPYADWFAALPAADDGTGS